MFDLGIGTFKRENSFGVVFGGGRERSSHEKRREEKEQRKKRERRRKTKLEGNIEEEKIEEGKVEKFINKVSDQIYIARMINGGGRMSNSPNPNSSHSFILGFWDFYEKDENFDFG